MELDRLFIAEYSANVSALDFQKNFAENFTQNFTQNFTEKLFEIRTCQRTLLISTQDFSPTEAQRFFSGPSAYDFLLRFACGLESEIKGETDVFGQIKTAFKHLLDKNPTLALSLQVIFTKLFEDTKEIRAQYLQGVGGSTYGALAKRLLNPQEQDQILILGAGQISKSVAPYFADFNLKIWNRSETSLHELGKNLDKKGYSSISLLTQPLELETAIQEAHFIIFAIPPESSLQSRVLQSAIKNGSVQKILHLGAKKEALPEFENYSQFFSLSELFALEQEQNLFREKQVQQALDACSRRAILRNLSRSIHVAHGWEDLALFY